MKESKKREHVWIRKMFMLMAAFVLVLCMKTTTYAAATKTVNMESVGSGMYIHIGTMKRGKGTVYHRVKVKKKGILIVAGAAIAEDGTHHMPDELAMLSTLTNFGGYVEVCDGSCLYHRFPLCVFF